MAVKLLMTWNIRAGREQEYFEFVVREFIPQIKRLGLEPTDAWYTVYGKRPQIMTSAKSESLKSLHEVIDSSGWASLINKLLDFVENFEQKIVADRSGFQL